jgi:hypothetical protein
LLTGPRGRETSGLARSARAPRDRPCAVGDEREPDVLRRREAEVARVRVRDVARAQEVEQEPGDSVRDGEQPEEPLAHDPASVEHPQDRGEREEHDRLVEPEVVTAAVREAHREEEVRVRPRVIVHGEAADTGDAPPRRDTERERVAVVVEADPLPPEVYGRGEDAAEEAAQRREPHPEQEYAPGVLEHLRVVEEQVHEVSDEDAREHAGHREVEDDLRVLAGLRAPRAARFTAARMPSADRTPKDWMVKGPSDRLGSSNHGMSANGIGPSVYDQPRARPRENA